MCQKIPLCTYCKVLIEVKSQLTSTIYGHIKKYCAKLSYNTD